MIEPCQATLYPLVFILRRYMGQPLGNTTKTFSIIPEDDPKTSYSAILFTSLLS
jgi:hypothetical protein